MSNLSQFVGATIPMGGSIYQMPYGGDVYTAPDGTQWYSNTPTSPFAYTSAYSYLPDHMVSSHPIMNGPESNGLWMPVVTGLNIAYNPTAPLYCTAPYFGNTTDGWKYYTSSDGSTWTQRTFPNPASTYSCLQYTASKFIGAATGATANGVITSTDGINWTTVTGINLTPQDIVSDGGSNIVIIPTSTTAANTIDGGTTWVSNALPATPSNFSLVGQGVATWNAGAGLFIVATTTAGTYMTSPTGAVWTLRNTQSTFSSYSNRFAGSIFKVASNATTTIAVGYGGFFATTTDGLTWSNHGLISPTTGAAFSPTQVYYDGTRFVVRYQQRVWYSTNGTTWTEGKPLGGFTLLIPQSNGVLFGFPLLSLLVPTKVLKVSDVSSTSRQTVISPILHVAQTTAVNYYRIR